MGDADAKSPAIPRAVGASDRTIAAHPAVDAGGVVVLLHERAGLEPTGPRAPRGWTPDQVAERIAEAMETLARLPPERPSGFRSSLPAYIRTAFEAYNTGDPFEYYGSRRPSPRPGAPEPRAIDRMIETLHWLRWLSRKERAVVQSLALRPTWDYVEAKFKRRRTTIKRWQKQALERICERLNR